MSSVHVQARLEQRGVDVDLKLADGQVLAVIGPNGAGKSTLLSLIAGLLRPDEGRIELGDVVVTDTSTGVFVPAHARGVAMLSQQADLFPHLTVAANVAFAPRCQGRSRSDARAIAQRWLEAVDARGLADRRPAELSGGQAQRVAVARALAAQPQVLLLDEPLSALDVTAAPALRRLLRDILRDNGRSEGGRDEGPRTAVIVTHDLLDALAIADEVVVFTDGHIVERGTVRSVLTSPRSDFAARIAGVNLVTGVIGEPGILHTNWGTMISGSGELVRGASAVALFQPAAVAVYLDVPHGSPRNVVPVTIAEMDIHGTTVRVRGANQADGGTGLAADVTAAAAADLDLAPGREVFFVVKTQEVELHPTLPVSPPR